MSDIILFFFRSESSPAQVRYSRGLIVFQSRPNIMLQITPKSRAPVPAQGWDCRTRWRAPSSGSGRTLGRESVIAVEEWRGSKLRARHSATLRRDGVPGHGEADAAVAPHRTGGRGQGGPTDGTVSSPTSWSSLDTRPPADLPGSEGGGHLRRHPALREDLLLCGHLDREVQ